MNNNIFSTTRFKNLLVRQVSLNLKGYLVRYAAITGVLSLIAFLTSIETKRIDQEAVMVLFFVFTFVGGMLAASQSFREMYPPSRGIQYLTLPVSKLERLLSAWLLTSIGLIAVSFVLLNIAYYLASVISNISFGSPIEILGFGNGFGLLVAIYLVTHPLFILGAITFKKFSMPKTVLSLIIIGFGFGILASIIQFVASGFQFEDFAVVDNGSMEIFMHEVFVPIIKVLFWGVLAPFCLIVSYFKLKEREL